MNSKAWQLLTDPITLIEAVWAFYELQLVEKGFTVETYEDAVDEDVMPDLKERFIRACAGFFPFVTTVNTMLQGIQPGSQNFQMIAQQLAEAATKKDGTLTL